MTLLPKPITGKRTKSIKRWVGKTPDSMPPASVRLRIFEDHGGVCHLTGLKIKVGDAWELDHVVALCNGGENIEENLAPALKQAHREKTTKDVKQRAKDDRVRRKHYGIDRMGKPKSKLSKKFDGSVVNKETGEVIREAWKPKGMQ